VVKAVIEPVNGLVTQMNSGVIFFVLGPALDFVRSLTKRTTVNKLRNVEGQLEFTVTSLLVSSLLARQPLVGPGLFKKLYPFDSFEGDFLPILDP
jgi:hypothetical protein